MNAFLKQLCDWLNRDRFGRKILLCRSTETGNQLLRMAASHGTPAVNVQAEAVLNCMTRLAEPQLLSKGLRRIDHITASIALQNAMEKAGDAFTTLGTVELTTADSVLPQLTELERNRITPEQLESVGEPLLASVWERFMSWKHVNGYASEEQILENASIHEDVSFAVLSNLQLTKIEQCFLDRILKNRLTVIQFETPDGEQPPRNAILQKDAPVGTPLALPPCVECQDIGTEIRWALQYLIETGTPAEETVIVCPDDAYGLRVEEEGHLLGIPVDSAFGVPADSTKTALLIRCLLDWADRNYDVEALRPALVSGAISLYDNANERHFYGQEILRILREQSVGWGKDRWEMLSASDRERYAFVGRTLKGWVDFFEFGAEPIRQISAQLTALLTSCMPQGIENEFYLNIVDEVSRIYDGVMEPRRCLTIVQSIASTHKIRSIATETPGRVYCCGIEDALYVDRPHMIVLGMSWDVYNKLAHEFPLLHDDEKTRLSPLLHTVGDAAQERRYAILELLTNRRDAQAVFSRARMDHVGGEELMAASLFDDALRRYPKGEAPRITILGRRPLTELDVHVQTGFPDEGESQKLDKGRDELWRESIERRVWSATTLETAFDCPRRFVLSEQLGINPEKPQPLEQYRQQWLSPTDRGSIVHEVLEAYFTELSARGTRTVDPGLLTKLVCLGIEEAKRTIPVPSNLTDISAEQDGILRIVTQEADEYANDASRRVVGTEVAFGSEEPLVLTFGSHRIRLKGRIDRIDRVNGQWEIIDYKTGRPSSFRRDFDTKLQYYLYTLAWEKLHPDQPVSRAVYDLLDGAGGVEKVTISMTPDVRAKLEQGLTALLDRLLVPEDAFLPRPDVRGEDPATGFETCPAYCPYLAMCAGNLFKGVPLPGTVDPADLSGEA